MARLAAVVERSRKRTEESRSEAGEGNEGQTAGSAEGGREGQEGAGTGEEIDVLTGSSVPEEHTGFAEAKLWQDDL